MKHGIHAQVHILKKQTSNLSTMTNYIRRWAAMDVKLDCIDFLSLFLWSIPTSALTPASFAAADIAAFCAFVRMSLISSSRPSPSPFSSDGTYSLSSPSVISSTSLRRKIAR